MKNNEITIVPTTIDHIRVMAINMCDEDIHEAKDEGVTPFKRLWKNCHYSDYCQSGFMGNRIVAIWGISGSTLGFVGEPWVIMSTLVNEYPFVFVLIYRRETQKMLKQYRVLEKFVGMKYVTTIKLMKIVGFKECNFMRSSDDMSMVVRLQMEAA